MKKILVSLFLLVGIHAMATSQQGIVCRNDQRLAGGGFEEVILWPNAQGYGLQVQSILALSAPAIQETWAEKLSCRIDANSRLVICENEHGHVAVRFKARSESYLLSIQEDKKKTDRYIDIIVEHNGDVIKSKNFSASHCQTIGGEA